MSPAVSPPRGRVPRPSLQPDARWCRLDGKPRTPRPWRHLTRAISQHAGPPEARPRVRHHIALPPSPDASRPSPPHPCHHRIRKSTGHRQPQQLGVPTRQFHGPGPPLRAAPHCREPRPSRPGQDREPHRRAGSGRHQLRGSPSAGLALAAFRRQGLVSVAPDHVCPPSVQA